MTYVEIHWTCAYEDEAIEIANELLKRRLVACVQIYPQIDSLFFWKGKIEKQKEIKVVFKTKNHHFKKIKKYILENAKYEIPEILVIPIISGYENYLYWVDECVELKEGTVPEEA